jgi:hypothetical protein
LKTLNLKLLDALGQLELELQTYQMYTARPNIVPAGQAHNQGNAVKKANIVVQKAKINLWFFWFAKIPVFAALKNLLLAVLNWQAMGLDVDIATTVNTANQQQASVFTRSEPSRLAALQSKRAYNSAVLQQQIAQEQVIQAWKELLSLLPQ